MRDSGVCPKCSHRDIILVDQIADTGEVANELRAMHLAIVSDGHSFFGNEKRKRAGALSAVVCRDCGHTELFVKDPKNIPIDGKYVTRLPSPPTGGPHR